jgi:MYXO-CTERM domain-containing protein
MVPKEQRRAKRLANPKITSAYLGLSETSGEQQLNRERCEGKGPFATLPYYKLGRRVMYDLDEVDRWLEQHRRVPVSQPGSEQAVAPPEPAPAPAPVLAAAGVRRRRAQHAAQ